MDWTYKDTKQAHDTIMDWRWGIFAQKLHLARKKSTMYLADNLTHKFWGIFFKFSTKVAKKYYEGVGLAQKESQIWTV